MAFKVHGFAIGSLKKGYFETVWGQRIKVITHKDTDHTILPEHTNEVDVYLQLAPAISRQVNGDPDHRLIKKIPFKVLPY